MSDVDDELWYEQFLADERRRERQFKRFSDAVRRTMRSKGAYTARSQFVNFGGSLVIHRSTRPGVAFQVTQLDSRGPSGHADARDLETAIKYAWQDLHPEVRASFDEIETNNTAKRYLSK